MYQEKIHALCKKIYSSSDEISSKLILSNGNFKSGSTWVTAIIHEMFDYRNVNFPNGFQNPKHTNWINRFKINEFLKDNESKIKDTWISKSHIVEKKLIEDILLVQDKIKIINIDRDLKDVLVSHYHHLINAKKIKGDFKTYFYNWGLYKTKQILDYRRAWKDFSCLKLKYEDLLARNQQTIQSIADYLNYDLDENQLLQIQKETDIENLRSNLKNKNLNEEEWFFRKGEKGDWKNYFDESMVSKINEIKFNKFSNKEKFSYYIKFTLRLRMKYFLYKYFPSLYVKFDRLF